MERLRSTGGSGSRKARTPDAARDGYVLGKGSVMLHLNRQNDPKASPPDIIFRRPVTPPHPGSLAAHLPAQEPAHQTFRHAPGSRRPHLADSASVLAGSSGLALRAPAAAIQAVVPVAVATSAASIPAVVCRVVPPAAQVAG